jgi:hypothetical protein
MVVILLSLLAVALVPMLGQTSSGLVINRDTQSAAQLAQECAEYLLQLRRTGSYDLGGVTDCSALSALNGFGPPAVAILDPYAGDGCPLAASCKLLTVTASYASGTAAVNLMLVDY